MLVPERYPKLIKQDSFPIVRSTIESQEIQIVNPAIANLRRKQMFKLIGLGVPILTIMAAASANADMVYNLTQDGCTGGCGTPPFGTVTLIDNGFGSGAFVSVIEHLAFGEVFAGTG